ncbi:DUF6879 family protein [Actinomadura formosensis]|uniref:DUF6879 family protein n=1 Tax=Actinomadura formosensis TaxID=60706 RepID=UPI00082BF5F5|nr:DUF6879 family protein [Actinomadura formosensis]
MPLTRPHFRYTAYRLEALQRYDVSYEKEEFALFLAGQARGGFPGIADWIEGNVRPAKKAGKRMHRVHVVEEPLSDYVRFECAWSYEHTVPAGEDVRIIPVGRGEWPEGIPRRDYWLFDSCRFVTMHYERDGAFAAAEIIDDPEEIVQANHWRGVRCSGDTSAWVPSSAAGCVAARSRIARPGSAAAGLF